MQHKWHKEIKAWADGAEIEAKWDVTDSGWFLDPIPRWNNPEWQYRIKPTPKEPQYLYVYRNHLSEHLFRTLEYANKSETYIGKIKLED
jgi:hypothetical protein